MREHSGDREGGLQVNLLTHCLKLTIEKLIDKFSLVNIQFLLGIKFNLEITNKKRENSN